jgi:PAS domain S-box-containing protein
MKKAEQGSIHIEDTELVLEELFRHTPVGVVLTDMFGTVLDVNAALCAMLGYDRTELIGRNFTDVSHPDDITDVLERTDDLRFGRTGNYVVNRRYLTRTGEEIQAKVSVSIVYSKSGEPVCGIGIIENITERMAMEAALRQSEMRYRRVLEDQTELITRCLPDGTLTFVNSAFCRYNNATAGQLLGTSLFACMNADEQELVRAKFAALSPSNVAITDQHWVIAPGGMLRWHEWTDRGFFDAEGRLVEIQSVGRDLTEWHEAQQKLVESEARYRRLFNSLPVAVWENDWGDVMAEIQRRDLASPEKFAAAVATDPKVYYELGTLVRNTAVNPAALAMAGVATQEEFERWLATAATRESAVRWSSTIPALMFGEASFVMGEYTLIRANGEPIEVLVRIARAEKWGESFMTYPIAVDITDAKRAAEELARHRDELVRADKMITLGILVSGMAHEINNPNHTIALNAPLVRDAWREASELIEHLAAPRADVRIGRMPWTEARAEVTDMLEDIETASERIRYIVSELRNFALDQDPGERQSVNVNDVVQSAARLVGKQIARATRHFDCDLPEHVPPILGNARRLEQVVVNLIMNACQALEHEEQAIRVTTGAEGGRVFVRVRDEGHGIAPEHLPNIRTPFFTTKRAQGGTGLGLPVSDRIAKEHGGELTFESELGGGTTATLWLPPAKS